MQTALHTHIYMYADIFRRKENCTYSIFTGAFYFLGDIKSPGAPF